MIARVFAISLNTFREAVRDRVPLALFGCGFSLGLASLIVAAMSLGRDRAEVVAVLTSATLSLFSVLGAVVLGATLLYKDLQQKTIFPILARPIRRAEVVIGKHFGLVATILTFAFLQGALALTLTAIVRGEKVPMRFVVAWITWLVLIGVLVIPKISSKLPKVMRWRDLSTLFLWAAPIIFIVIAVMVGDLGDLRKMIAVTVLLAVVEAAIVAAISMVFGSFMSPFLTAACTTGIVLIGRNTDLLAKLPERTFGHQLVSAMRLIARIMPNLYLYVPPRIIATGRGSVSISAYVTDATLYGLAYALVLLVASAMIFQRRDFA